MVTTGNKLLRIIGILGLGALVAGPLMASASATEDPARTAAEWRTQKLEFTYMGFTAFYTCDGLESKVRYVLLTFGARSDAKVHAYGCDRAQNKPNKIAWVEAEFSSLAPAQDASNHDAVPAVWGKVQLDGEPTHGHGHGRVRADRSDAPYA